MNNPFEALIALWRRPTPLMVATRELAEAELAKLEAQSGQEYAASLVSYHDARIKRLRKFMNQNSWDSIGDGGAV